MRYCYTTGGWEQTWRSAAVHWGEGTNGWKVSGTHLTHDPRDNSIIILGRETVTDCSIYDGWWDNNK